MAFTVRIELHKGEGFYDQLHEAARARGLVRFIKSGQGVWYHMPWAEYDYPGIATPQQVYDLALQAVQSLGKTAWILVTEVASRIWSLDPVT